MRQRGYGHAVGDMVVQLDLISKVRLEAADKYCYSLPDHRRTNFVVLFETGMWRKNIWRRQRP
jgi:hypothetical protein